jgi:hypothetical protein
MALTKVTIQMPYEVYTKLKIYAVACNVPMRQLISKLLYEDVEEIEKVFAFPEIKKTGAPNSGDCPAGP